MRIRHKLRPGAEDTFGLISTEDINKDVDQFTEMIAVVVVPITLISLVVGGIVVMYIMLVSVTERTREIGVRKAIGAKRNDIVYQFLFEAMTLSTSGGLVGIFLAVIVSYIILWFIPDLPATIPSWAVVTGFGVSVSVGLIFGVWPAVKASRLDPFECLRYE
jgi:putative ABC transport system permease protein